MSGTLTLAAAIAELDREALEKLVASRRPQSVSGVHDPIGLASELLRPDSIERALMPLDRSALAAALDPARAGEAELVRLSELGLVGRQGDAANPLPEVVAVLRAGLQRAGLDPEALLGPPGREADGTADEAGRGAPDVAVREGSDAGTGTGGPDTSAWYATALSAVAMAAEILRTLAEHPGRLNRNGTIAVATAKSVAESTGIDAEQALRILRILFDAGLIAPNEAQLAVSPLARRWLSLDHVARWSLLARTVVDGMPEPLRALLDEGARTGGPRERVALAGANGSAAAAERGADLAAALAALPRCFPLLSPASRETAEESAADAEQLGLAVSGTLSPPALALLAGDRAAAGALAARDMPPAIAGVYIQPDLSVVVPGPLVPADEAFLSALSRPEHIGVASTRRITESSLAAALERGTTSEEARSALSRLSLTGIPQPLDYLLNSAAERARSIVVSEHDGDEGRTRVVVNRPELLSTLLVDRALQHLQFARDDREDVLFSRLRPEHVVAALSDARYLTSFEGGIVRDERRPEPSRTEPAEAPGRLPAELVQLVDRVLHAARADSADFTRLLELAIRDRSRVRVTASAQGQTRSFTLQPVSLDAGRLRASDPAAGVERTLPVNMITAVEAV